MMNSNYCISNIFSLESDGCIRTSSFAQLYKGRISALSLLNNSLKLIRIGVQLHTGTRTHAFFCSPFQNTWSNGSRNTKHKFTRSKRWEKRQPSDQWWQREAVLGEGGVTGAKGPAGRRASQSTPTFPEGIKSWRAMLESESGEKLHKITPWAPQARNQGRDIP